MRPRQKRLLKRSFLAFMIVIGVVIAFLVGFVQSARFARIVKSFVQKNIPEDWSIQGDFSEFRVNLLPPGMSIKNPKITLGEENIVNLPADSKISAERIDFKFYPLQMLSGNIRVHEAVIVNGDVQLTIDPKKFAGKRKETKLSDLSLNWDELFQIRAEAIVFENTRVQMTYLNPSVEAEFIAKELRVGQWSGSDGLGYEILVELSDMKADFPEAWTIPEKIEQMKAEVRLNAAGVRVKEISLKTQGIDANLSGEIDGNIFLPKKLLLSSSMQLDGDVVEVTKLLELKGLQDQVNGLVRFEGQVQGDLMRMKRTLEAEGAVYGREMKYQNWQADRIEIEGKWIAQSAAIAGELALERAVIESDPVERLNGDPARGGRIEIKPFKTPLGVGAPFKVEASLENAHIHWLIAPEVRSIYPLDFRFTGTTEINVDPGRGNRPWGATADVKGIAPSFQLDNQTLGVIKPVSPVIALKDLDIDIRARVDREGLYFEKADLRSGESVFEVFGKVDAKTGYHLFSKGAVQFEDFEDLAGTKIRGGGAVSVSVQGPSDNVIIDFDVALKDSYYISLFLGDLTGRITLEEAKNKLIFKDLHAKKPQLHYIANGSIDFGLENEKSTLDIGFDIQDSDINQFMAVFKDLTTDLWWFPSSTTGPFNGKLRASGGVDLDRLVVSADLRGTDWDFYGEKFSSVRLKGAYDKGRYVISDAWAKKYNGELKGNLSYGDREGMAWKLTSRNFTLSDLDRIVRLDVPIRGNLNVNTAGVTKNGFIQSSGDFRLRNFVVRGRKMSPSFLTFSSNGGVTVVNGEANGGQATVALSYDWKKLGKSSLRVASKRLDLSPLMLLINPSLMQDDMLSGTVTGVADLKFQSGKLEYSSGQVDLKEFLVTKRGKKFFLESPVSFNLSGGSFSKNKIRVRGQNRTGELSLSGDRSRLAGRVTGIVDVSFLEFLFPVIVRANGDMNLDYSIGGTIKEPVIIGKSTLDDGQIQVVGLDSNFEKIRGVFRLKKDILSVQNLRARLSKGRVLANGTVEFFSYKYPTLDINADLSNNRLNIYPFQYVQTQGKLHIHGETKPYAIDGDITVPAALIREKMLQQNKATARKSARYTPPASSLQYGDIPTFMLNIDAKAPRGVIVKNDLFDAELKGRVKVLNTISAPRLLGEAELIRGKMGFKGRDFSIESATIVFDNPAIINPKFNMASKTNVKGTEIRLFATGEMEKFNIELASDPVLPEQEILSLLALGFTSDDLQRFSGEDRSALQQGEAASLLLHSFDFNRDIRERTGFEIQVEESVDLQSGTSIFRKQDETDATGAAPKLVVKRRIGKRVDVSVGSTVGAGTTTEQEVNAEVHVTPAMSVMGVWNSFEGINTQDTQTSYGLDLKVQKRFK